MRHEEALGSWGLYAIMDKGERGQCWDFGRGILGNWQVEKKNGIHGTYVASKLLLGNPETMRYRGNPVNRLLFGNFISNAKVNILRFPSWSGPFNLYLLGRKGEGQKFFLHPVFLNNQLNISIPEKGSFWKGQASVPFGVTPTLER